MIDYRVDGKRLSGLLIIPSNFESKLPVLAFQHGFILEKRLAPAQYNGNPSAREFSIVTEMLGVSVTYGYIVCMVDYPGLGDDNEEQSVFIAEPIAESVIGMIRATINHPDVQELWNGQLQSG